MYFEPASRPLTAQLDPVSATMSTRVESKPLLMAQVTVALAGMTLTILKLTVFPGFTAVVGPVICTARTGWARTWILTLVDAVRSLGAFETVSWKM